MRRKSGFVLCCQDILRVPGCLCVCRWGVPGWYLMGTSAPMAWVQCLLGRPRRGSNDAAWSCMSIVDVAAAVLLFPLGGALV